jgi:hypothetical protein
MGIPYSKQINAAFDEVTPLVAAGFTVLRTSRNISILLAVIQILTVILLGLILFALFGILVTLSPELEEERKAIVSPTVKWILAWMVDRVWIRVIMFTVLLGGAIGGFAGWYWTREIEVVEVTDETAEGNPGEKVDT